MAFFGVGQFLARLRGKQNEQSDGVSTGQTTGSSTSLPSQLVDYASDGSESVVAASPQVSTPTEDSSLPIVDTDVCAVVHELLDHIDGKQVSHESYTPPSATIICVDTESDGEDQEQPAAQFLSPSRLHIDEPLAILPLAEQNKLIEQELTSSTASAPMVSNIVSINDPLLSFARVALSDTTDQPDMDVSLDLSIASTPADGDQLFPDCALPSSVPLGDLVTVFATKPASTDSAAAGNSVTTNFGSAGMVQSTSPICSLPACEVRLKPIPLTEPALSEFIKSELQRERRAKRARHSSSSARSASSTTESRRQRARSLSRAIGQKVVHFAASSSDSTSPSQLPSSSDRMSRPRLKLSSALRGHVPLGNVQGALHSSAANFRKPTARGKPEISASQHAQISTTANPKASSSKPALYLIRSQSQLKPMAPTTSVKKKDGGKRVVEEDSRGSAAADSDAISVGILDKLVPRKVAKVVRPTGKKHTREVLPNKSASAQSAKPASKSESSPAPKSTSSRSRPKRKRRSSEEDACESSRSPSRSIDASSADERTGQEGLSAPKRKKPRPKCASHTVREKMMTKPSLLFANSDFSRLTSGGRGKGLPTAKVPPRSLSAQTQAVLTNAELTTRLQLLYDQGDGSGLLFINLQHSDRLRVVRSVLPKAFWGDFEVAPLLRLLQLNCSEPQDPLAHLVAVLRSELIDTRRATHTTSAHGMIFHYALPLFLQRWGIMSAGTSSADQWSSIGQHYGNWSAIVRWVELLLVAPVETAQMARTVLEGNACPVSTEFQSRLVCEAATYPGVLRRWWLLRRQSFNVRLDTTGRSLDAVLVVPPVANWLGNILADAEAPELLANMRHAISAAENIPLDTVVIMPSAGAYRRAIRTITNLLAAANPEAEHLRQVDKTLLAAQQYDNSTAWIWANDAGDAVMSAVQVLQAIDIEQTQATLGANASVPSLKLVCRCQGDQEEPAMLGVQVPLLNWMALRDELNAWARQFGDMTTSSSRPLDTFDNLHVSTKGCSYFTLYY